MIHPANFFVLRQPVFSLQHIYRFYERLLTEPLDGLLRQHYQNAAAQRAILAASPALYERLQRWLLGETLPEHDKLLTTLHKYFVRMCSRPTPYGLFAGCAVGAYGPQTQLQTGGIAALHTHQRLDIDNLLAIRTWLTQQQAIRNQLQLVPNSSVYPVGSSLRYVEQQDNDGQRHYFISAVEENPYLMAVLEAARNGATIQELIERLTELDAQPDEAAAFIEQLIEGQLLVFTIEPAVTGLYALDGLIARLEALPTAQTVAGELCQLRTILQDTDFERVYHDVRQWLTDRQITPQTTDVLQVDAFFNGTKLRLSERMMQQLNRNLEKLLVLNQPHRCPDLDEFKHRFYNRYEDEEVPLALALDSEFGVGYGSGSTLGVGYAPLIDDLTFSSEQVTQTTTWDWWQTFVMDKYANALRTQQREVLLSEDDLNYIGSQQRTSAPLPYSFYVFGTLLAASEKAIDNGDFRFNLLAYRGPSGLSLLSRFCEGEPQLEQHLRASVAKKELFHADVIFAEIVHLPEDRVGNILSRPALHRYEIPYLGQSSVSPDYQISLADLMVSIRNNTLILRSKRLNRRVIPRLTNAHNFTHGLPIYRFLCDLQSQDAHLNVAWNWGVLRTQTYLPRVRYHNIILSRATWQLKCRDLTPENPLRLVAQLTAAGLPDQFLLTQGDNELCISMHVPASLALLAGEIKKHDEIRLTEFLASPDNCPLSHQRERFTHELILPFYNTQAKPLPGLSQISGQLPQRKFSVGSEWFYLKIYTGEKTSDALLVQAIYPVVQQLLKTQIVQAFFFVRYKDTDPHLRLRFRGNPHLEFYQYVVRATERALQQSIEAGVVYRVQVDTYQRELERYGTEHIDRCETLFHHDSLSTLAFLTQTGDVFDENTRFAFAVRKIDVLLTDAGLSVDACLTMITQLKESFFQEFGGRSELRQQLNEKYRTYRPLLAQALSEQFGVDEDVHDWRQQQATLLRQLGEAIGPGEAWQNILKSLVHMLINRLFPSKQRAYELVLYHCLAKHYDSVRARLQPKKS